MKLTSFLATHRYEVRKVRKAIAVGFACGCAFRALRNGTPIGKTILLCTLLALCAWGLLLCIDRVIGSLSPIVIDLRKIKDISTRVEGGYLYIENETFVIKACSGLSGHIDSFQLFEKIEAGDLKLESSFTSWTGENCLLRVDNDEFKLDAGLAKHLLAILNRHVKTDCSACHGLSFLT